MLNILIACEFTFPFPIGDLQRGMFYETIKGVNGYYFKPFVPIAIRTLLVANSG